MNSTVLTPELQKMLLGFGWQILKLILLAAIFMILVGMVFGFFTYGRPIKPSRRRKSSLMDDILDGSLLIGSLITYSIIDLIRYKLRKPNITFVNIQVEGSNQQRPIAESENRAWLDDRQLIYSLRQMKPTEFEHYMAKVFRALGYEANVVGGKNDGGIDLKLSKDGQKHLVQCKKYITRKVRPHDVRDFYGAIAGEHIDGKGFFVTTNVFTYDAVRFAEDKPLELIDGSKLVKMVRDSGLAGNEIPNMQEAISNAQLPPEPKSIPCPKCGGKLVTRMRKKDRSKFLGCSNFPKCRQTKNLD